MGAGRSIPRRARHRDYDVLTSSQMYRAVNVFIQMHPLAMSKGVKERMFSHTQEEDNYSRSTATNQKMKAIQQLLLLIY